MAQLKTTFAGLTLNNPIIISSSGLTNSLAKIQKLEEAGAGAVVLKSVFEEQINMQAGSMQGYGSPEADDYLGAYVRSHALNEHITLIEDVKKHCKIPVIASINCYSDSEWTDFARLMEEAGADALELNILSLQTSKDYTPGSFEQRHIDILCHIKKEDDDHGSEVYKTCRFPAQALPGIGECAGGHPPCLSDYGRVL